MSSSFELDPVDRVTTGAIGEPGDRTFYVQAAGSGTLVTLLAEKEQVRLLAEAVGRLLAQIPDVSEAEPEPAEEELDLLEPVAPEWRVGEMTLEYDEAVDRVAIVLHELRAEGEEGVPAAELLTPEPAIARFVATRAQARAMALHALEVVAAGRPRCQLCGLPLEADGDHVCPATNGHRAPSD